MNYLAHALLSPDDPHILMGNLWGDLLRPKDFQFLEAGLREGVSRHKAIDAFTDQHPAVNRLNQLIRPFQGKYTPVVTDVLMDFMLSKYWDQFQSHSIELFCAAKYLTVHQYLELIPDRLHPRINRMLGHRWLESCSTRERMTETLKMLSRRASFQNTIPEAMVPYDLHQAEMDELFLEFFGELEAFLSLQSAG
ncbi:MAG TPA: ACP phosphodiesterase [Saprospiraceae bacterium]|nr:ACP phosphodiesterase [Saprospiraceae bacterium]